MSNGVAVQNVQVLESGENILPTGPWVCLEEMEKLFDKMNAGYSEMREKEIAKLNDFNRELLKLRGIQQALEALRAALLIEKDRQIREKTHTEEQQHADHGMDLVKIIDHYCDRITKSDKVKSDLLQAVEVSKNNITIIDGAIEVSSKDKEWFINDYWRENHRCFKKQCEGPPEKAPFDERKFDDVK